VVVCVRAWILLLPDVKALKKLCVLYLSLFISSSSSLFADWAATYSMTPGKTNRKTRTRTELLRKSS